MDEEKKKIRTETTGQEFVRWLKPGGCALVIIITILVIAICFISGRDPIPGFAPAHDTEYYLSNMDDLTSELEENVFPVLDGIKDYSVVDGKLNITVEGATFAVTRAAILRYYDNELFVFIDSATGNKY